MLLEPELPDQAVGVLQAGVAVNQDPPRPGNEQAVALYEKTRDRGLDQGQVMGEAKQFHSIKIFYRE